MTGPRDQSIQYVRSRQADFLKLLVEYTAFPSVSTDAAFFPDIERTAGWVADRLRALGMQNVALYPTAKNPVVYGEYRGADEKAPTVLVYGHYDVQPADPLDLWESPPFEAVVRGEHIFGRGIADMKSQLVSCLAALEAIQQAGPLPVNLKFMIEGEEEIGSPSLNQFVPDHRDLLACDFVLNLDGGIMSADIPTITYSTRGIAVFELTVTGPTRDVHSGLFGGAVANPIQVLCRLVGGMQDDQGRITLPGFYDRVRPLSRAERAELNKIPGGEQQLLRESGVPRLWGETGYTPAENTAARPTLDVNGIYGGYSGEGIKTIIPSAATAKISMRLVPDQDPREVGEQLQQYLREHAPDTIQYTLKPLGSGFPAFTDRQGPPMQALDNAIETVWRKKPIFIRMGGSVPVLAVFQQQLGVEVVNTGFAIIPEARVHSPNENQHIPTWQRGTEALVHYFLNLA